MTGNDVVYTNVDRMMDVLKQELAMEQKNALYEPGQQQVNYNTNKNEQMQQMEGQQQKQMNEQTHDDPFLDQLKGLWSVYEGIDEIMI